MNVKLKDGTQQDLCILHGKRLDRVDLHLEQMNGRVEEISEDVKAVRKMVTGNGNPEDSLWYKVNQNGKEIERDRVHKRETKILMRSIALMVLGILLKIAYEWMKGVPGP